MAGKRLAGPGAVADGAGRDRDRDLVVEGHEAEAVLGAKPADQGVERLKRREEAPVGHRAAAVDHHLERGRWAVLDVVRGWGGELEEGVDGVLVLDRDQVVLELELGSHERLSRRGAGFSDAPARRSRAEGASGRRARRS